MHSRPPDPLLGLILGNCFSAALLAVLLGTCPGIAQEIGTEDEADPMESLLDEEERGTWWDADWKLRRKVTLDDPKLQVLGTKPLFLDAPDLLLLYNTGRCQDGLRDLRVVTVEGSALPCGVVNFGQDDGTSSIWCRLPGGPPAARLSLFLYYGNPKARATGDRLSAEERSAPALLSVMEGPEERAGDGRAPAAAGLDFFGKTFALEAETFVDGQGRKPEHARQVAYEVKGLYAICWMPEKRASGGAILRPRALRKDRKPLPDMWQEVTLPDPGVWYIHVRYTAAEYGPGQALKPIGSTGPFTLLVRGKAYECGLQPRRGALYQWDSFEAELPKGTSRVGLRLRDRSAPDCIVFTTDEDYRPDYRDLSGPVWMRFKVTGAEGTPYYGEIRSRYGSSENDPKTRRAHYVFRERAETTLGNAVRRAASPDALIAPGKWSPWATVHPFTGSDWWAELTFRPGGHPHHTPPMKGGNVSFQLATRADLSRIFREGTERTGPRGRLYVKMPRTLRLDDTLRRAMSFGQWARERSDRSEALGFRPGQGPKTIAVSTIASATSATEADLILRTLAGLGLNAPILYYDDAAERTALLKKHGFPYSWTHARPDSFPHDDQERYPLRQREPFEGLSCLETMEKLAAEYAEEYFTAAKQAWSKTHPWELSHAIFNDLGDEIGPVVDSRKINGLPLVKKCFIEYLQRQELTPGFSGLKEWGEIEAVDYVASGEVASEEAAREARQEVPLDGDDATSQESQEPDAVEQMMGKQTDADNVAPAREPKFEKRLHHYTQKFRSALTCMVYGKYTAALPRYVPTRPRSSPNLQAQPIHMGRMWQGQLNIFELARNQAFNALQMEDWTPRVHNVMFGMSLLRAAARKHKQPLASIIPGFWPKQRLLAHLSCGSRYFLLFIYGPLTTIGPAWAEDERTLREIGETLRLIARAEGDILSSEPRPADAALLVANTTEINARYFVESQATVNPGYYGNYPFGRERMAIFSAFLDAQVPMELLSEEEVVEDDALSRYRILYVADPHVARRAQKKIKQWVADGGTLWASYAALSRQEFDEPSGLFDEVLGLESRGEVRPFPYHYGRYVAQLPPGPEIVVPDDAPCGEGTFRGLNYKPSYTLSTGTKVAHFADGAPAIVHNRFGKGQAYLHGFLAGIAYAGYAGKHYHYMNGSGATRLQRNVVTVPALGAGVRTHVRTPHGKLLASVHDGAHQTVIFLNNCTGKGIEAAPLEVRLPRPPQSAYCGRKAELPFKARKDWVEVTVDLPIDDVEIVVFKF